MREAVATLPGAQPLPPFAGGASAGDSDSAGDGVDALRGILHCRHSPLTSSSNGHSQSPFVAVAEAGETAGASNRRSRRRSSKSEGGVS